MIQAHNRCLACGNEFEGPGLQCPRCRTGDRDFARNTDAPVEKRAPAEVLKRPESEIRKEITAWAYARGALFVGDFEQGYRADRCKHCGGELNHSTRVPLGTPDLLIFWPAPRGQWWIECKSATGKQSEHQVQFEHRVRGAGGVYVLARSIDDCEAAFS